MNSLSWIIFVITYAGVAVGGVPRLAIDRTGIALLGAIAMVVAGVLSPEAALDSISLSTLALLYGLMIVSAQLRLGGFYTHLAVRISSLAGNHARFLFVLMVVAGLLSSVLANDIICLAFTPVLTVALLKRGTNPIPFLLGLAAAANIGSAATIIGNPQNMLIGQAGGLSFAHFILWCGPPSLVCLVAAYGLIHLLYRNRYSLKFDPPADLAADWPSFNTWQSVKGLLAAGAVVTLLFMPLRRDWSVITVAGVLLLSRKMHTRSILGLIDWHLITLFGALFIVVAGFNESGIPARLLELLGARGLSLSNPYVLSIASGVLSNIVSNVPAVVMLNPHMPDNATLWYVLALSSTYAGNLLTIGSLANLIVIEQARTMGVKITFGEYARMGVVVTAMSFAVLWGWIALVG